MKSQRAYVLHVLDCIGGITADSDPGRDAVFASRTLQDAILRNLQVLCESVSRIEKAYKEPHAEIDWKAVAGIRNVLVHDYFVVDFEAVWDVGGMRDIESSPSMALAFDCAARPLSRGVWRSGVPRQRLFIPNCVPAMCG